MYGVSNKARLSDGSRAFFVRVQSKGGLTMSNQYILITLFLLIGRKGLHYGIPAEVYEMIAADSTRATDGDYLGPERPLRRLHGFSPRVAPAALRLLLRAGRLPTLQRLALAHQVVDRHQPRLPSLPPVTRYPKPGRRMVVGLFLRRKEMSFGKEVRPCGVYAVMPSRSM